MKTYGLTMPKHQAVILQDVLMYAASGKKRQIGFEKALKLAKLPMRREIFIIPNMTQSISICFLKQCYEAYFQMAGKRRALQIRCRENCTRSAAGMRKLQIRVIF